MKMGGDVTGSRSYPMSVSDISNTDPSSCAIRMSVGHLGTCVLFKRDM
jgi:hypothetical protein